MKASRIILVGTSVALSVGAVAAFAQTRMGIGPSLTPRLDPFNPGGTLSGSGWRVDDVPIDRTGDLLPFIPPSGVRPPFFPPPRSPYFPGPR